ncbi:MAG: hypothetical protein KKB03_02455 [Nanoarchaeota archaeon]|nr:hypothetical protein [Nanoarchaeota archaeon]MBU1134990.1 hypothetical protein [Nanoarchaeota archaeon]MBU2520081.1 hypothetical protein [Nanoarchaeota archaeon]
MVKLIEEIKKQTLTLMVAAFGFVAALVWKDAISEWLKPLYGSAEGPLGLTIAAFVVTIIVVIVTIILAKLLGEKEKTGA